MEITNKMIGKYVTRTGPCKLGNGHNDYSYIGEKMKILSVDKKHIRFAVKAYKSVLDERWLDDNWKEYEEITDIDNLDLKELTLLQDSLKALIRQDIGMNFKRLNQITRLGVKIEEQINILN